MTLARPSRPVVRLLRALLPRDEADAVLGDLSEDLERRAAAGQGVARGRLWLEMQAWGYVLAVAPAAAGRTARTAGHIVRDALRALRAAPRTTAGILVILTVSITAATVTFSVVDTVVLRPLPFEDDHELVAVEASESSAATPIRWFSPFHYVALRERLKSVSGLAAVAVGRLHTESIIALGSSAPVVSAEVTASLFDVLRVQPVLGRAFTAEHETAGNSGVALISHGLWLRLFGGDPAVVGRTVQLTGTAVMGGRVVTTSLTLIGVMPRGFTYPLAREPLVDIWTPYVVSPEERTGVASGWSALLVGRRRVDLPVRQVHAEVEAVGSAIAAAGPERSRSWRFGAVPLKDTLLDPSVRGWMVLVLAAVAVLMLVACANVANLQLARAAARTRELSIRASLGATRRQLVLSLLTESLVLALVAAGLAILASVSGVETARSALPANLLRVADISVDLRVLLGAIAAALLTALVFGAMPAWQASRSNLVGLMKEGAVSGVEPRRWRAVFLVAEIAFVSVLLVCSTLIISSFIRVTTADLGFTRSQVLEVLLPPDRRDAPAVTIERLRGLPGVAAAGNVENGAPPLVTAGFGGGFSGTRVRSAQTPPNSEGIDVEIRRVSSGYFDVIRNPVIGGQVFDDGEVAREKAIVVDEQVALALFGRRDAVGLEVIGSERFAGGTFGRRTVAAVIRHMRFSGPELPSRPQVYLPVTPGRGAVFVVRTSRPTEEVIPTLQAAFGGGADSTPGASVQIRRLEDAFRNITAGRRFNATLMSIFGALAVFIGAAGVYGVMASVVSQQTRELGIRVALGATTGRIVGGVLTQAGRYLVVGLALGLPAAWWASRSIASLLFEIRPTDAGTYAIVVGVMTAAALVAAWIPARRAARIDPLVSLRAE